MLIQLALKQALLLQRDHAHDSQQNFVTEKYRTVHGDCLKLYENTVFHLNRTLESLDLKKGFSAVDTQTWLTTALTNIRTCRTGAIELNAHDIMVPTESSNNITEMMIRNSLAINVDFLKQNSSNNNQTSETEEGAFPSWFSWHERKLVQSSLVKANFVVAKDGSGNFRTVQDALSAAAKRRYKTRFVIHVKKGVYRENVEVAVKNDNIMLVGDGMKNTIITSGRSVHAGFTTYSSATAGIDGMHSLHCTRYYLPKYRRS
ncbi:probable pectinesterase/pectinesterase inhibitor 60 [Lotus japonicus]|uniref:probable pectinesterase/pectinesterase inhibitor 60 n=1 Tax=Lotus japonicus TaxID=34305 RepID=UPI00258DA55F|nr:probable pectinesterase/pectinesterase inhibitor 60 [Lotus japonicus]